MGMSGFTADGSSAHLTNSAAGSRRATRARLPSTFSPPKPLTLWHVRQFAFTLERPTARAGLKSRRSQRCVGCVENRDVNHLVRPVPRVLREQFGVFPVVPH